MKKINTALIGKDERFKKCYDTLNKYSKLISVFPLNTKIDKDKNKFYFKDFQNFYKSIKKFNIKYVFCAGYGKYIKYDLIKKSNSKWINLHASIIPNYRGGSPLNWSIINKEKYSGVTMLEMTSGIDSGPIILQSKFKMLNNDYNFVSKKASLVSSQLVEKFFKNPNKYWSNRKKQNLNAGSYFTTRQPKDSFVSFKKNTDAEIMQHYKALKKPIPLAFFNYGNLKIELIKISLVSFNVYGPPGRIAGKINGKFIIIAKNRGINIEKICFKNKIYRAEDILKTGTDAN